MITDSGRFDLGRLVLVGPLRSAAVVAALMGVTLKMGEPRLGVPLVVGALFVALTEPQDAAPWRLRVVAVATVCCALTSVLGGLVSGVLVAHLLAGALVAAVCGYAGILGARAALIGVVSLVLFLIFSGTPIATEVVWRDGLLVLAGGAAQVLVLLGVSLLGREGGARAAVATAFRYVAVGASNDHPEDPAVADAMASADKAASHTVAGKDMQVWLRQRVHDAEQTRFALMALGHLRRSLNDAQSGENGASSDAMVALSQSVGAVARQVARALVLPWRRRGLGARLAHLDQVRHRAEAAGVDARVVASCVDPVAAAGLAVASRWPPLRRAAPWRGVLATTSVPFTQRLAPQPAFVNHAVRLAIAIALGIAFAYAVDLPHSYWLPLTVAWVARPDLGSTLTRVVLRVVGTLAGVLTLAVIFAVSAPGTLGFIVLIGLGTALATACMTVNYAVAVTGITTIMLTLFASVGEPIDDDLALRAAATVAGGALVAAVALVRPQRASSGVVPALVDALDALRRYATALVAVEATALELRRDSLQQAVNRAHVAVGAVEHEPGTHRFPAPAARAVLGAAMRTAAHLFAAELSHVPASSVDASAKERMPEGRGAIDAADHNELANGLSALADRLRAFDGEQRPSSWHDTGAPLTVHLSAAHQALDDLLAAKGQ
jgi:uncharacterized membrane protein YccC